MSYIVPTTIGTRSARAHKAKSIMAISKSFFGLRRGSTKDLTFSTYRGQQVTKARVASVANPQTLYQMEQRMRLVQVANAATKLKGLINHSFEGVPYGQESISRFRAMNLTKGVLTPESWVPKGVGDCGVADFVISKGSLPEIKSVFMDTEKASAPQVDLRQPQLQSTNEGTVGAWVNENGFVDGDQLTFLAGFQYGPSQIVNGKAVYFHRFAIERLIIRLDKNGRLILGEEDNPDWDITSSSDPNTAVSLAGNFFEFGVASSKESTRLSTGVKFIAQPYASSLNFSYDMFGCILSRKDGQTWRRSFCQMATKAVPEYVVKYDDAAPTYIKSTASNKYLNLGPQKTGILGDQ